MDTLLWPLKVAVAWVMVTIHKALVLIGFPDGPGVAWVLSIIGLTIVVRLLIMPLFVKQINAQRSMQAIQPEMRKIQDKYKGKKDPESRQRMNEEMMALYRKHGTNPMASCLPILVQMPVFLALYWVLLESVEMRQAPWMFWITDLSIKDPFFILPIIMGATMFIQQQLNPTPPDPMQAKVLKLMPVIFTFFFLWFPAGLVLYWVVNNILSIAQQWYITRQIEQAAKTA